MSVANGQKSDQNTFNNAFMSKTTNSTTVGVIDLNNTSDLDSGPRITNAQQAANEIFDAVGMTGIDDAARKDYTSNNYISNGDSHKSAIGKLDDAIADLAAAIIPDVGVPGQITLLNNSAAIDIPDLLFDSVDVRSFEFKWTAYRESTGGGANIVAQRGSVLGIWNGTAWKIVDGQATPDDAGVTFDIDLTTGQVNYTTTNQAGTYQASTSLLDYLIIDIVGVS